MARQSCINHPPSDNYIKRRKDYVAICEGNTCAAELLDLFEYWTNCKLERVREVEAFNETAIKLGQPTMPPPNTWLYERIQDLKAALIEGFAETSIKRSLGWLKKKGFIEDKPSPTKFDNTKLYKFCVANVQAAIDNWHKLTTAESTEKYDETKITDDQLKVSLDETIVSLDELKVSLDETETSDISNTHSQNLSKTLSKTKFPPTPLEGEQTPAYEDSGSKEPTSSTLDDKEKDPSDRVSQEQDTLGQSNNSSSESNRIYLGRDNNIDVTTEQNNDIVAQVKKPKRNRDGDAFFGQKQQEARQKSFAARLQRTVVPIEEMEPWRDRAVYEAFEAHLLKEAERWKCENPASYVAKKLHDISIGKAPKTEFTVWLAKQNAEAERAEKETDSDLVELTPEQEAWCAIASELQNLRHVEILVKIEVQSGIWHINSNFQTFNGRLDEVMGKCPLSELPVKLKTWYADCYAAAKKKSPHLDLPKPLTPQSKVS